jgi:hypothetical protein
MFVSGHSQPSLETLREPSRNGVPVVHCGSGVFTIGSLETKTNWKRFGGYIFMNPERWAGDRFNPEAIMVDDDFRLSD